MTSILYCSNQEVKSSASGCGVTWLNDYHIRLVCCSQAWPDGYDLEPIRVNGLWVPGLGQLILNAPYLVIDTMYFPHMRIRSYEAKSHAPFSYGLLIKLILVSDEAPGLIACWEHAKPENTIHCNGIF